MSAASIQLSALVAFALVPSVATSIPGDPPASEVKRDDAAGHARMLALLEEIRRDSLVNNRYLGTAVLDDVRSKLEKLPPESTEPRDPRRFPLLVSLGSEELRMGHVDASIAAYQRAVTLLDVIPDRISVSMAAEACFGLGTAWMRKGENENCCARNDKDSCILPIQGGGLHTAVEGSTNAIRWFTRALDFASNGSAMQVKARWLLNVAFMTLGRWPDDVPERWRVDPKVFASDEPFPRFVDRAPDVGLSHVDLAGGIVAEDFDGDGFIELVVSSSDTGGQLRYYDNDGSGKFVERTTEANLTGLWGGLNLTSADYDNDGDVDVLVLRGAWWQKEGCHPQSLLRNDLHDGKAVFTDVSFEAGLGASRFPTQTAAWADYDNDGDLDLYIGNECDPTNSPPCELFQNDGHGKFVDVAAKAGVTNDRYTKAVAWGDYDGDRFPDLYVSNMAGPNRLYHNNKDGTFTDVAVSAGVTLPISSFPCWFWDYDNDGALDIWVGGFGGPGVMPNVADVAASYLGLPHQGETMKLYKGDGRGGFREVGASMKLTRYTLPMGSNFGDLDNDGFSDFYLGTGYPFYEGLIPNVMYRNQRGKGFADVTTAGGFGELQKGHGITFVDIDDDGDQDVIERVGGAYPGDGYRVVLFENPGFDRDAAHWLKVRLVGETSNRFGLGARLRLDIVENGEQRSIHKLVNTGGSFGANPWRQELGLGRATKVERLEVTWPTSNTRQVLENVAADQAIEIREGASGFKKIELKPFKLGG